MQFEFVNFERNTFGKDKTGDLGDLVNIDNLFIGIRHLLTSCQRGRCHVFIVLLRMALGSSSMISITSCSLVFRCGGGETDGWFVLITSQKFTK